MALCLCVPFAILTFQLATGLPPLFTSAVPFKGPVLIAIYAFTTVLATAVIGDARVVLAGGLSGVRRISRHLWRMCLGLSLAAGSGFTNGFARLLPGPYHVPTSFFLATVSALGLVGILDDPRALCGLATVVSRCGGLKIGLSELLDTGHSQPGPFGSDSRHRGSIGGSRSLRASHRGRQDLGCPAQPCFLQQLRNQGHFGSRQGDAQPAHFAAPP